MALATYTRTCTNAGILTVERMATLAVRFRNRNMAAFLNRVNLIVFGRTDKKVCRIETWRIVATVAYEVTIVQPHAEPQQSSYAMYAEIAKCSPFDLPVATP